ncbi:MAG TPA: efflux RND transporter periplasmic adaptor subunit [Gemmataceae bacterium]|nr:efflux RND transporter periplasmic adaptor subunit [Gemmataceae bacterium]
MRTLIKWLVILGVIGAVLAGAGYGAMKYLKTQSVPRFTTAAVTTGKIETVVNSTGPIKPVQSVSVGSFISGPILEIFVDFNDAVKKGQLLARIDPRLPQASLDRENAAFDTQEAELKRIRAQLEQARANETRAIKLRTTNPDYLSEQEMDQLKFTRAALEAQEIVAKANIEAARAGVKNAEANVAYTKITSPVDGVIIDKKVEQGQTVASSFQTPELFIIAPEMEQHMHVFASVDEADIGQILKAKAEGRRVTFTVDAYPDDMFTGTIFQVRQNATTTQNVVTYPVVIEAPNPGMKLRPQMTANVSFQIDVREKATRIPAAALRYVPADHLIRPEDKQYVAVKTKKDPKEGEEKLSAEQRAEQAKAKNKRVVWVADGVMVKAIPVTIGLQDGQWAELVSGEVTVDQALVTGLEGDVRRESR